MSDGATPARHAALDVLRAVRSGSFADHALAAAFERTPAHERAWLQELVYGTLRLRGRLDFMLAHCSRRPLDAIDGDVLDILRLGAYQLEEMAGVPAYAAVSQSVELAKARAARGAAGFVNGVLQGLRRGRPTLTFPELATDPAEHLASWGSHPRWLVDRWLGRFGVDGTAALVEANNRRPELYLRAIGGQPEHALERLAAAGIGAEPVAFAPGSFRLADASQLGAALAAAPLIVQDPAAALVVAAVAPPPGALVIDACAAPGGKALGLASGQPPAELQAGHDGRSGQAAQASGAPRLVVAADLSVERLGRLQQNARRIGALPLAVIAADARRPPVAGADVVLVDAPCTGTGTLRRHPDGRWRVRPEDLASLAGLQAELLRAAAGIVVPGGLLVYATCSLEPEENEDQVESFLRETDEFMLEPITGLADGAVDGVGRLAIVPTTFGVDGAFAARLRRAA